MQNTKSNLILLCIFNMLMIVLAYYISDKMQPTITRKILVTSIIGVPLTIRLVMDLLEYRNFLKNRNLH